MSFNITSRPQFCETVKVLEPNGEESDFLATFEALDIPEFEGFDLDLPAGTLAFLDRVFRSADDVVDDSGEPVPFTPEIKAALIAKPWVRVPLVRAYLEGINRAARGN